MAIVLNPGLDPSALHSAFASERRVQVRDVMAVDDAERIAARLEALPWRMAFNIGSQVHEVPPQGITALTDEQRRNIEAEVYDGARRGFQFHYHYFPIVEPYFGSSPGASTDKGPLADLFEWINSSPVLGLVRDITGHRDIAWADCHAAMYAPGQFLNNHDDHKPHLQRRAAYVLNFTRRWRNDWGGYLQFFEEGGNVTGAFKPGFNMLNMFSVPQEHSVQLVSPYAQANRYSVTGWFRADDPPGEIGKSVVPN
ncbi:hypothetical protein A6F68_01329 [Tsuneonella dongtanensis]|uniref:Prolyl 3,4-dihydroxylase TPA1/OFD1 N-terminal domain-containing protein n=1 Tax=Tsuneonella dongtanensis TaxID=692370 RepID=A0A1B2ACH7_9SPHN|nr:2OG-Fe(II) oxygenase family protein [Tsuneonella dongtanensis]ANY19846.1 hypothetical protein A6F68_01329 [Tsuneonella dongtanensis]